MDTTSFIMVHKKLNDNLSHDDEQFLCYDSLTEIEVQLKVFKKRTKRSRKDTAINEDKKRKNTLWIINWLGEFQRYNAQV